MSVEHKDYIQNKLKTNMIMFGKVIMSNMFSAASPDFHYKIADAINNHPFNIYDTVGPESLTKGELTSFINRTIKK